MMRATRFFVSLVFVIFGGAVQAQSIITLEEKGGLHAAYVVPTDDFDRVDVQLVVLSGAYDDPEPSGTAHLTEHLAALSSDAAVLRKPRVRDLNATTYDVSTVYTNSGVPTDIETLLRLSRAVLDTPNLPADFAESEIDIVQRETLFRERRSPRRWLKRIALQNLYGTLRGRANNAIEDLPGLNLEKAYQFHKEHYVPSNATLIVSGKIDPDKAEKLVARFFGDTKSSPVPRKPWLDQKPDRSLRSVERVETNSLTLDTVQFAKFVDFKNRPTSIDMQGTFFIATEILTGRLHDALYFEDERFLRARIDWRFTKNSDLELALNVQLMSGFSLDAAHTRLKKVLANLLSEPISIDEINQARQKQIVSAQDATRRPSKFLWFLQNVASDGFPPVSPSVFADMIRDTSDQEVIEFAAAVVKPSATSVILAKKVD